MQIFKFFSIVIPVFNEEKILLTQIKKLQKFLNKFYKNHYEILLIDNGSKDRTFYLAKRLTEDNTKIKILKLKDACYGKAIVEGIKKAKYNYIIQLDIDFIDNNFIKQSLFFLKKYDIIVGSKIHPLSKDKRPMIRIFLTKFLGKVIKILFFYPGTDTHGIKAYKKNKIRKILKLIKTKHHFFETEIMLRAYSNNFEIKEIPVNIQELRPSRFPVVLRFYQAIYEFIYLIKHRNEIIKKNKISS